jgi:methionine-rich copper-binding protein CopC
MYRHLLTLIILSILLSSAVFAYATVQPQTPSNASTRQECPTITISCPEQLPESGKTYTVGANVEGADGKQKLTYHWSLSSKAGEIVEGQGTPTIRVRVKYMWDTITATVEVCGLADKCQKTASCSFVVAE